MRLLHSLALVAVACALTGCFEIASTLSVRPDGSAVLTDRVEVSGMGALALADADGKGGGLDKAHFQARATALGDGVTLVSVERRETGFTAVYAVPDVRRLRYTAPDLPLGEDDEDRTLADESLMLSFEFDPGDPAALRVVVPEEVAGGEGAPDEGPVTDDELREARRVLEIARSLLGDARMAVEVVVEGDIVDTDAAYVDGSTVTVYDVQFGSLFDAIAENPELMREGAPPTDMMLSLLAGREGVQIEEPGVVQIRFE